MSTRETVLEALRSTLAGLSGGRVYRSRREQLPDLPAIIIRPDQESDPGDMLTVSDSTLTVAIEIYARGEIPDQAADTVLQDVLTTLKSNTSLGLGSNVQIMPSRRLEWSFENYDDVNVTLRIDIQIRNY